MRRGSDAELVGVENDGDRTIVGKAYAHVGAESAFFDVESLRAQRVVERMPYLFGMVGARLLSRSLAGCLCVRPHTA